MAKQVKLEADKTYATLANLERAVEKVASLADARYLVLTTEEGRFYPVFLYNEQTCTWMPAQVAQHGWCVVN